MLVLTLMLQSIYYDCSSALITGRSMGCKHLYTRAVPGVAPCEFHLSTNLFLHSFKGLDYHETLSVVYTNILEPSIPWISG